MAAAAGYDGTVVLSVGSFGSFDNFVTRWTLTDEADALDSTSLGTQLRSFVVGRTQWSGSFEAFQDAAVATVRVGVSGTATLTSDGTRTYAGSIILTGADYSVDGDGVNTVTCSFQGTGALAIS